MSVGYQGEELPVDEEAIFGINLVYSSFCKIGAANIEPHGKSFYDHGPDLEMLVFSADLEGQGTFEATLDV